MCFLARVCFVMGLGLFVGLGTASSAVTPDKTTKAKYDDFYSRQKKIKQFDKDRTSNTNAFKQKRQNAEKKYEEAREQYVSKRKSSRSEEKERKAEQWMQDQQKRHEEQREKARANYLAGKKQKLQYAIPEREEFDIHPPTLQKKEAKEEPRRPRASRFEGRDLRGSGRLKF